MGNIGVREHPQKIKDKALELYRSGLTAKEIEKKINVSWNTINSWCRKAGLSRWREENPLKKFALKLYNEGLSSCEISKKLDINASTVCGWIKKSGLKLSREAKHRSVGEKILALKLYDEGISLEKVGKIIGVTQGTIHNWVKREGIDRSVCEVNSQSKTQIDLSKVSDQEFNWYLGWLYSDGHVCSSRYRIEFKLGKKDIDILDKISCLYTKIGIYNSAGTKDGACFLNVGCKQLHNHITSLGFIVGSRLGKMTFPAFAINSPFTSHFIRGFFEGDGCLGKDDGVSLGRRAKFYSTSKAFLEGMKCELEKNGIECSLKPRKKRNPNWNICYTLRIFQKSLIPFIHYIYDTATPQARMNRKYNYAMEVLRKNVHV